MERKLSFEEAKGEVFFAKHKRIFAVNDSGAQAIIVYNPINDSVMSSDGSEKYEYGWDLNNTADTFADIFRPDTLKHHVLIYTDINGKEHEYLSTSQYVCMHHLLQKRWSKEPREQRLKRKIQEYHRQENEKFEEIKQQIKMGLIEKDKMLEALDTMRSRSG